MWHDIGWLQQVRTAALLGGLLAIFPSGCSTPGMLQPVPGPQAAEPVGKWRQSEGAVRQAGYQVPEAPSPRPVLSIKPSGFPDVNRAVAIDDLARLAVERNPRIARATIAIDAAQGRYVQAGLYPNPDLAFAWDEIGDRTGAGGIITAPRVTQTIVTGRKLSLAQAVAAKEIDQATLDMLNERYTVLGSVRAAFYEVFTLQERLSILIELVKLAEQGVVQGKTLVENQRMARLDLIQLEVELERFRTEAAAVERELPAAYRRLAAVAGDAQLPIRHLKGSFEALPEYDLDQAREAMLSFHPEVRSARVGIERAQAAVRAAEVQPIPNITVSGGYIRQFENQSHDGAFGLSAPFPVWNRNQGNIREARAQLGMAIQSVGRVENDLSDRLATAYRPYAAARIRAERYRLEILPRAEETLKLSLEAFKGGQFEYLRVIQAQRAVAEARLELNRSMGEAWRAAAELSGLLLEEAWPAPIAKAGPAAGPVLMPVPTAQPGKKP